MDSSYRVVPIFGFVKRPGFDDLGLYFISGYYHNVLLSFILVRFILLAA